MRIASMLILAATVLAAAAPAPGQTLSERIDAVRKKHARQAAGAEASSRLTMLQALLYTELTVDFDEAPAREVFDYFGTALGVNVVARYSDDAVGYGIDPQTPITLSADDEAAVQVLNLVLEQCAVVDPCTWQLRDGFLEVGTKERLSVPAARETRWYPIDQLVFEAPKFDDAISLRLEAAYPWYPGYNGGLFGGYGGFGGSGGYGGAIQYTTGSGGSTPAKEQRVQQLIDLIVDLVEPQAWTVNGGDSASIFHRDGALIVRAPEFIQRQISGYPSVPPPAGMQTEQAKQPKPATQDKPAEHDRPGG